MANIENSFADRLQRGHSLHSVIVAATPVFAPADADLAPAAFATFLSSVAAANTAVATTIADWHTAVAARTDLVVTIKDRALRALNRVKSNRAWDLQLPAVKAAADKLRGYRQPKPKLPPDTPAPPTRQSGDQSFADIKQLLTSLNAALGKVAGYDTGAPVDITVASLTALATQLDGQNTLVAGREQALAAARASRSDAYDGETGLRQRMTAIKAAIASQYGTTSPAAIQAKAVRL